MREPYYYRDQAERARRLARSCTDRELEALLQEMEQECDDIAEDLDKGAIEIRHLELMPQNQR